MLHFSVGVPERLSQQFLEWPPCYISGMLGFEFFMRKYSLLVCGSKKAKLPLLSMTLFPSLATDHFLGI